MSDLLRGHDWLRPVHHLPQYPFGAGPLEQSTVCGALARHASVTPDAPFLTGIGDAGGAVTFRQAWEQMQKRAALLAGWGLQRGDRVGILGPNSVEFALSVLAVLEAGAVGVLLNDKDPEARIANRAEFAGVRYLLYDSTCAQAAASCPAERLCSFDEFALLSERVSSVPAFPPPQPTDAALIFFTSGTTGMPKAVVQSHFAVARNAVSLVAHHGIAPGRRLLCVLPMNHVNGLEFTILATLMGGGNTFIAQGLAPLRFWALVEENDIHIVSLVPNLLRMLAERPKLKAGRAQRLRYSVSAAAPLSTSIAEDVWTRLGLRIVQGYGLSEVTNFSCVMPAEIGDAEYERWMMRGRRTSIGPALPGQEVRILSGAGSFAGPEEEGEVVIRGHSVMSGYLHNEKATEQAFEGGWFHSGDLGYFLEDDHMEDNRGREFMHIAGRIREIAKRSGAMVNLLEVDEVLAALPGIADAACTAFPNRWVDEEIGAVVVRQAGATLDSDEIIAQCRRVLPFAEVPKAIVLVDRVPRTATGKVRRGELVQQFSGLEEQLFVERNEKSK